MPSFIRDKAGEKKWLAIKHSVAKQRGKSVEDFTDRDWATVNAAWHKSEGNIGEFQKILKSIPSLGSIKPPKLSTTIPNPAKVGIPSVKMPKSKKLPGPGDKPSVFFKHEIGDMPEVKHATLMKLKDFLLKKHKV